ncbi:expressed unknown protein [Seminavis robusta]|uniref:C2H2-type domain-containing protein n=1 Tax=Seminavis robusta TaxID=568900 RepID=A0A9N8H1F7_9STRA|nr:expressed unknown protein [Seminavis robusta]|eukprot:Sro3_g002470.1 n/a (615) ;mRNA; f:170388-172701
MTPPPQTQQAGLSWLGVQRSKLQVRSHVGVDLGKNQDNPVVPLQNRPTEDQSHRAHIEPPRETGTDVLCESGQDNSSWRGNIQWCLLVHANTTLFATLPDKHHVLVQSIVGAVGCQHPPGRFLQKDLTSGRWCLMDEKKAEDMTFVALEKASKARGSTASGTDGVSKSGSTQVQSAEEKSELATTESSKEDQKLMPEASNNKKDSFWEDSLLTPNASTEFSSFSFELQSKKGKLKLQLKQYDIDFARRHDRMPGRKEKEPIRHLYDEYNALKCQIAMLEKEGDAVALSAANSSRSAGQPLPTPDEPRTQKSFTCYSCSIRFPSSQELDVHILSDPGHLRKVYESEGMELDARAAAEGWAASAISDVVLVPTQSDNTLAGKEHSEDATKSAAKAISKGDKEEEQMLKLAMMESILEARGVCIPNKYDGDNDGSFYDGDCSEGEYDNGFEKGQEDEDEDAFSYGDKNFFEDEWYDDSDNEKDRTAEQVSPRNDEDEEDSDGECNNRLVVEGDGGLTSDQEHETTVPSENEVGALSSLSDHLSNENQTQEAASDDISSNSEDQLPVSSGSDDDESWSQISCQNPTCTASKDAIAMDGSDSTVSGWNLIEPEFPDGTS